MVANPHWGQGLGPPDDLAALGAQRAGDPVRASSKDFIEANLSETTVSSQDARRIAIYWRTTPPYQRSMEAAAESARGVALHYMPLSSLECPQARLTRRAYFRRRARSP